MPPRRHTITRSLLIAAVALAAVVLTPWFMLQKFVPRLITPHTPASGAEVARSSLPPLRPAGRVDVVIVDGLGYAFAEQLPELAWLREQAARRPLLAEFPSYTSPALISFVTGLGPRDSGVRINGPPERAISQFDSLTKVARDSGRPIRFFGGGWKPFGPLMQAQPEELQPGWLATATRPLARHGQAAAGALEINYVGAVDTAGHRHGGTSTAYRAAAQRVSVMLHSRLNALDLSRDVLVIVSDHGHIDRGGHGGVESSSLRAFLAVIGRGALAGEQLPERPMVDLASTLAVLSGLPSPAHNSGRPMLDMFSWSAEDKARALAGPYDQTLRALCAMNKRQGTRAECRHDPAVAAALARGDSAPLAQAEQVLEHAYKQRRFKLEQATDGGRGIRFAITMIPMSTLLLLLAWRLRRAQQADKAKHLTIKYVAAGSSATAVLYGVYVIELIALGYRLTFSAMPSASDFMKQAAIVGFIACIATLLFVWRRGLSHTAPPWLLASTLVPFVLLAAYTGLDHRTLPPPYAGIAVILLSPLLPTAAIAAMLSLAFSVYGTPAEPPAQTEDSPAELTAQPKKAT